MKSGMFENDKLVCLGGWVNGSDYLYYSGSS